MMTTAKADALRLDGRTFARFTGWKRDASGVYHRPGTRLAIRTTKRWGAGGLITVVLDGLRIVATATPLRRAVGWANDHAGNYPVAGGAA